VEKKRELVRHVSESSVNIFVEKIYEILSMDGGVGWLVSKRFNQVANRLAASRNSSHKPYLLVAAKIFNKVIF
jgi:hypothetical protein